MTTNSVDFISKQQFTAVYDHFRKALDTKDGLNEDLEVEFRLLLGYFRSAYEESERKTHKISQLMAEVAKLREKVNQMERRIETERGESEVKMARVKDTLDKQVTQERLLAREIDELKENLDNLKSVKKECRPVSDEFMKRYEHLLSASSKSCRDMAVGTESKQECVMCSKRNSKKEAETSKDKEIVPKEYENLNTKIKILSAALELSRKEVDNLRKTVEERSRQLAHIREILEKEKENEKDRQEEDSKKIYSLRTTIDKLLVELEAKTNDLRNLQDYLKKVSEDKNSILLENRSKDDDYVNMKRKFDSILEDKISAARRAKFFESHLAQDQKRLFSFQREIESLNEMIQKLKKDIRRHEIQEKMLDVSRKRLEASQMKEAQEQKKVIELYKTQAVISDNKIRDLTEELEAARDKLAATRKLCRDKKAENTALAQKLSQTKNIVAAQNANVQCLKVKPEDDRSSNAKLQAALKYSTSKCEELLREKDKLRLQCRILREEMEDREIKSRLLQKQQDYYRDALKVKDTQVEKFCKMRRSAWVRA